MNDLLEIWNGYLLGGLLPLAMAVLGGYFLWKLRFVLFHPLRLLSRMLRSNRRDGVTPLRAMSLSLAGVLGVGNLVGVASAILYGGAGAIFWMWVSATLAMTLKYAEVVLSLKHRRSKDGRLEGSAMYYIEDSLAASGGKGRRAGRLIGGIFALLLLLDAVCMGCMIQVNAISSALTSHLPLSPLAVGLLLGGGLLLLGLWGDGGVVRLAERMVPLMTVGFCLLSLIAITRAREALPDVLGSIVREGLMLEGEGGERGILGGIGAFLLSRGLRYGTMRGLLSNEAGCGTAPMAHADTATDDPVVQGGMGMLEVFVDTHLLCTMTALVILLAFGGEGVPQLSPMLITLQAFERLLGAGAGAFLCGAVVCFGLATVLCWLHYLQRTGAYLFSFVDGRMSRLREGVLLLLYCVFSCVGAVFCSETVWQLSDFAIGSMTLINLWVLWRCRREITRER